MIATQPRTAICAAFVVVLVLLFVVVNAQTNYYKEFLNGFWQADGLIAYIDADDNTIRVMETINDDKVVADDKISISIAPFWISSLCAKSRSFAIRSKVDFKASTNLGALIQQGDVTIEAFPTEGVVIVSNQSGDLVTLTMDVITNLEML